ncbi:hypothetical protein P12x_004706 [Tundrisphaera lichenicola]|uniref:hypothetical protein n=1 Tax=Tundrisphaera lichenicola TaxID=2029860 RepID=UPI003EC08D6E
MALRFLLVSLVASMGLDLPGAPELAGWARAGRDWAEARMVEFSAYRADAGRFFLASPVMGAEAEDDGLAPETADLAFDVVVEGMASNFAAELLADRRDQKFNEMGSDVFAKSVVPDIPTAKVVSGPAPESASVTAPSPSVEVPSATPKVSRGARISSAVELTRQAMSAWVSLIVDSSAGSMKDSR